MQSQKAIMRGIVEGNLAVACIHHNKTLGAPICWQLTELSFWTLLHALVARHFRIPFKLFRIDGHHVSDELPVLHWCHSGLGDSQVFDLKPLPGPASWHILGILFGS